LFLIKRSAGSTPAPGTNQKAVERPCRTFVMWSALLVLIVASLGVLLARALHALGLD
jgi:hypothetical protein